jgi:hypothetical protein
MRDIFRAIFHSFFVCMDSIQALFKGCSFLIRS